MQNEQSTSLSQEARPLVTFIVTYYNLPVQQLCECIDSILALSLSPAEREIILVDDGSEVSPLNALMQYGDDILYIRQKNQGVSVARNTALNMARGAFIQIVDGDDTLLTAPYEQCLDIARRDNEAEAILFDFTASPTNGSTTTAQPLRTSGTEYMRRHNIRGAIWCCLFRQRIRGKLEFTPSVAYGEDEEFTPQLLLRAEVVYVTEAKAYYYRQRTTSAVHQVDEQSLQRRLNDTKGVIRHLNELCDKLPPADRLAMQRRVAQLTMDYIYNTIVMTRSRQSLNKCLDELHAEGLFPLPDREYSAKYTWFRRMTNTSMGRTILLHTLPLLKRER